MRGHRRHGGLGASAQGFRSRLQEEIVANAKKANSPCPGKPWKGGEGRKHGALGPGPKLGPG